MKSDELNSKAIELIQSDYMRNYLEQINHKFTYKEQLAIIMHSKIELSKKRDILQMYVDSPDVKNELGKEYYSEIQSIINEIYEIYGYASGISGCALIYNNDGCTYCSDKLSILINKIELSNIEKDVITVGVYSLQTADEIGTIDVDNTGKIVNYSLSNGIDNTLYDSFINIPNDIHMGDLVKTIYGDEVFVVVNELITPNKFKDSLTYSDSSLVVIPVDLLDSNEDYNKQIENIYANRINDIENPCAKPDIIMENYAYVNIFDIVKISSGEQEKAV